MCRGGVQCIHYFMKAHFFSFLIVFFLGGLLLLEAPFFAEAAPSSHSATASTHIPSSVSFFAPKVYTTYGAPDSVAIGDLNGDGKPDLAVANSNSNTVSVFLNKGNGIFAPQVTYPTGHPPTSVAIGDLNGDGKPDLVVTNDNDHYDTIGTVSVFINKGNGIFAPKVDYTTGVNPHAIAIGDLNGDGKPDLAVTNMGSNTISVFLNKGNGTFAPKVDYITDRAPDSVAIGDLNGNGKPDIAVTNIFSNTVSIYLNKGNGTFASKVDYPTGIGPDSVAIGDLNGDGNPDLAVANFGADTVSNTVSVFINKGNGTFASKVDYHTGAFPQAIAIGDLNGDGKPDLAVANEYFNTISTVSVFLNKGNGIFAPKVDYTTGVNPHAIAIGDLNGDGKPDLAVTNMGSNTVSVLLNSSTFPSLSHSTNTGTLSSTTNASSTTTHSIFAHSIYIYVGGGILILLIIFFLARFLFV